MLMVLIFRSEVISDQSKKLDIKFTKHTLGARDFSCMVSSFRLNLYNDFGLWPTLKHPAAHEKKSLLLRVC